MADIGINPRGTRHDRVVGGVATEAGIKFGDVVVMDTAATGQGRAVKRTTTAGDKPIAGVVVTQCGPSGCAIGDNLEICEEGIVEVNLLTATAIAKGDELVTSTTAGQVKKLAAEALPGILGRANMDMASTTGSVRISCELNIRVNPYPTS